MIRTRRIDTLDRGYSGDLSVIAVLAAVISVMALVWLVLKITADPMERTRLPEEARLAALTLVPVSGPWLGVNVTGPCPADTLFGRAAAGEYDCVVAMYHDQGLIPIKLLAWREAVNVTLGLPIIRTSPSHGTAFDIAGKNQADPASMIAAIRLALELARGRRK